MNISNCSIKATLALLFLSCLIPMLHAQRVYVPQYKETLDPIIITGATIDETAVTQIVYVNSGHANASDSNPGTDPDQPILTLEHGIDTALARIDATDDGVKLFVANGTYTTPDFEWIGLANRYRRGLSLRQKLNTLIIEGESRGGVIIDCTEAIPNEQIVDLGGGLFGFPWTKNYGFSKDLWPKSRTEYGSAIAHRLESVFVNREGLEQVILEPHTLNVATFQKWIPVADSYIGRDGVSQPGTFGVSEIEEDMIFFRPPEGVDMSTAKVRVGVGGPFFEISEKSNLVIRNLIIFGPIQAYSQIHAAFKVSGVVGAPAENILIEDVEIHSQSSGDSLGLSITENVTMRRVVVRGSGGNGFGGGYNKNIIMEDLDFSENNWRSALGGIESWVAAGWKFYDAKDVAVDRYVAYNNGANGLWFDTDSANISVNELYAVGNSREGFYNEKNFGEVLLENSVTMNNGRYGINQAETGNSFIRNCISLNNANAALGIRVRDTFDSNPAVTDQWLPQDIVVEDSLLMGNFPSGTPIYAFDGAARNFYLDTFVSTFSGSGNQYWTPIFTNVFTAESALDFEGWVSRIPEGQEVGSQFADPGIDLSNDGIASFYLFEGVEDGPLQGLKTHARFNQFDWDYLNKRPVLDMPYNWRRGAAVEVHFVLNATETGAYTIVMNTNLDAALFIGSADTFGSVSTTPAIEASAATTFRDWSDAGNGRLTLNLEGGSFYQMVIRAVAPEEGDMPFLSLGWNTPWMEVDAIKPIAAPYIRSSEEVPVVLTGFLSAAERKVNNSFALEGFGAFWEVGEDYIYHAVHKVLYVPSGQSLSGFWGYLGSFGWTYFNPSFGVPWIYSRDLNSWIYSYGSFDGNSWYYVFSGPSTGYIMNP